MALSVDVRDESELQMFAAIEQRWGGVDIVVNNADLGHNASLLDGDTAQWKEMFDVNVIALCVCSREAVQSMRRRKVEGHIIHISSDGWSSVIPGAVASIQRQICRSFVNGRSSNGTPRSRPAYPSYGD